jgi:hypothetical protein
MSIWQVSTFVTFAERPPRRYAVAVETSIEIKK